MKSKFITFLLFVVLFMSACAPSVAPTMESAAPIVTETIPAPVETTPQPQQPVSSAWKVVRDARYGFGLAVPCWWLVDPIPAEGFGGVMTIKNYDEAFFNAHSNKGNWDWPNGSLKLDVVIMESVDPAKTDAEAYMQFVDPTMTGLVSAETQQVGTHNVTVLTLSNLINTNDPNANLFIFRLAPDKLLMVAPIPQSIISTPDFQAILTSIVMTPAEEVTLPTITPSPALIDTPCAG